MKEIKRDLKLFRVYRKELEQTKDEIIMLQELQRITDPPELKVMIERLNEKIRDYAFISERVRKAICSLENEEERLVILLRYIDGMTAVEIAKKLDFSVCWVHKMIQRAIEKMENSFSEES